MSHNIATINGVVCFAYQGDTPWTKLGRNVLEGITDPDIAAREANADWLVETRPLFYRKPDGSFIQATMRNAVVRPLDDVCLGTVGTVWKTIQNTEAFAILKDVCEQHGARIETVGCLGKGEKVFMLARMPEPSEPIPGDKLQNYILVTLSHDGTGALGVRFTRIRVVCQNTLNMATRAGMDFMTIRHCDQAQARIQQAHDIVNRAVEMYRDNDQLIRQMFQTAMDGSDVAKFMNHILGIECNEDVVPRSTLDERRRTMAELVWTGKGADLAGSTNDTTTAWAAYNAVCEYFDHVMPAEAKSFSAKTRANRSALFGMGDQIKMLALQRARELVMA